MLTRDGLAVALALLLALATFHPGVSGDLLRAWVVVGAGLLLLLRAAALGLAPDQDVRETRAGFWLHCAFAAVFVWVAVQLVPLPRGLIAFLSPETAAIYDALDAATGTSVLRPLSIEPVATFRALWLGLAYFAVFLVAGTIGRRRRLALRLALAVALIGGLVAVYAMVRIADLPVEDPWSQRPREPFRNPNHLCTFLIPCLAIGVAAVSAPAAVAGQARGRTQLERALSRRGLALVAVVAIVVGMFLSQSRAGLAGGGVAVGAVLLLIPFAGSSGGQLGRSRWHGLGLALAALAIVGGVSMADPDPVVERFEQSTGEAEGRLAIWKVAVRVIDGRLLGGSGLATFDDASFAAVPLESRWGVTRPESAHNDYLELVADLGLPVGLVAVGAFVALLGLLAVRMRETAGVQRALVAGALGGALGVAAHAVFDFGLQIPGPALLTSACLGLGWGVVGGARRRPRSRGGTAVSFRDRRGRVVRRVAGGVVLVVVGLVIGLQASAEVAGAVAHNRVASRTSRKDLGPELRNTLAVRAETALAAATGWGATAAIFQMRADVALLHTAQSEELRERALEHAREAAARAPGRSHAQMLVAYLLIKRWVRDPKRDLTEGLARLDLAVRLGPTHPRVLTTAGSLELDLFCARGDGAHLERAEVYLARVLRLTPGVRAEVARLVTVREARLGAAVERLRRVLQLDRP